MPSLEPCFVMLALEVDQERAHCEIVVIGLEHSKIAAIDKADKSCRQRGIDTGTIGVFNLMEPIGAVRPQMIAWLGKNGIPEQYRQAMVRDIAKMLQTVIHPR